MLEILANNIHFQTLNEQVRSSPDKEITITNCLGQRYIASGLSGRKITISGTPGNALGAYLDGSDIVVHGNAQDATGDTMNGGAIVIHGNAGDATGYAMRGGAIYVRGNSGYRTGIHMKAYREQQPAIVVGGKAGSFLGEYQAGGIIIVLGLEPATSSSKKQKTPQTKIAERGLVGKFCGTGIHGGAIYLRTETPPPRLPQQVVISKAKGGDIPEIAAHIDAFCAHFPDVKKDSILKSMYCVLMPAASNPYTTMYTNK
jgi:glutamate synthase domain-containing protein 3